MSSSGLTASIAELRAAPGTSGAPGAPGTPATDAPAVAPAEKKVPWYARELGGGKGSRPKSPKRAQDGPVLGAAPRVDLLPPEVKAQRRAAGTRRTLVLGVIVVVLVAIGASLGARWFAEQADARLADAQARSARLLGEQRSFRDVVGVQNDIELAQAAQRVGGSTEVDWKDYLDRAQATLPAGVTIKSLTIDSSSPLAAYAQPTAPLQGARVASITFTAVSPTIPAVPAWVDALATLPGFSDATPGSVSYDQASDSYTATISMHLDADAFDKRYEKGR